MKDDLISRQAVLEKAINVPIAKVVTEDKVICRKIVFVDDIQKLPPVTPERKPGKWIFTANHCWICSKCGTNPLKGTGYTPTRETMLEQWKFCNVCGAENTEAQNGQFELMRWIPVTERLPEDGQSVLFCDIDNDIMVGYHVKGRPDTHFTQDGTYEDVKNVRAYMPLPDPYEEGGTK